MADSKSKYGESFEPTLIFILSAVIVVAFFLVISLNRAYSPECLASEYTYCGEEFSAAGKKQAPHAAAPHASAHESTHGNAAHKATDGQAEHDTTDAGAGSQEKSHEGENHDHAKDGNHP